jgi:adenosylhomocysteine nucleosidase
MLSGVMSAMPEELDVLLAAMDGIGVHEVGNRHFHIGRLWGQDVVLVVSRCGKAAAAATTAILLERFGVEQVLFTGVAGAVSPRLRIGDVVIADRLMQHDMDASPVFPRYEIPLLGVSQFVADARLAGRALDAARAFAGERLRAAIAPDTLAAFGITEPAVHHGLIASGDKFFASHAEVGELRARLPEVLCVEMEGAAVAQVCHEYSIPCCIVRTISDAGDDGAPHDFGRFLTQVCGIYSRELVHGLLTL